MPRNGSKMKIVIWNCNMALHRKYEHLLSLQPDIAVIPECANAELLTEKAPKFNPSSSVWIGDSRHKGLGVFTFGAFRATMASVYQPNFPYIAPVGIDGPIKFNLLAVWACHNKKDSYEASLGPLRRAISAYRPFLEERPAVVAGDFNDNVLWDKPTKINKHSANVGELAALGLKSAYHYSRAVDQGSEVEPTIYWRDRKIDGPRYHIDYCFVSDRWTKSISTVTVGSFNDWIEAGLSDHVPLIVELNP
jgi:exodeoxyribonuclease-3